MTENKNGRDKNGAGKVRNPANVNNAGYANVAGQAKIPANATNSANVNDVGKVKNPANANNPAPANDKIKSPAAARPAKSSPGHATGRKSLFPIRYSLFAKPSAHAPGGGRRHLSYDSYNKELVFPYRRGGRGRLNVNAGAVLSAALILLVITVSVGFIIQNRRAAGDIPSETGASAAAPVSTAALTPPAETSAPEFDTVTTTAADARRGSLILVNAEHEYAFPSAGEQTITTVYGNKTDKLRVADTTVALDDDILKLLNAMIDDFYAATGKNDVLLRSGYRDLETQTAIYDERVETEGAEAAAAYVALPGHSEHHTGWAMDLSVYTYEGESFTFDHDETYSWITENCENYGFILRYPASKTLITGIAYEPWHFRWVGKPHAAVMNSLGLCLEEYVTYLAEGTSFDGERLAYTDADGVSWEIYRVPASESGDTEVPVPEGAEYVLSGDNAGGFIAAVKVK